MAALVIGVPRELHPEPMHVYLQQVEGTVARYGGSYRAVRQHRVTLLEGDWQPPLGLVVIEFPTFEQAQAWYSSPEYAPLRELRMAGDRWDFFVVEAMDDGETLATLGISGAAQSTS